MEYPPPRAKVFQPPTGPPSGSNATPFYAFCGPSDLEGYKPDVAPNEQTSSQIPKVFKDAMEVRVKVYVEEQKVPLQNEFDSDDSRSCHWVTYASVNTVTDEMVCDENDNIIERQRSKTETVPIGTLRLVPFPHEPHPQPGSKYTFDAAASSSLQTPQYAVDQATVYHDGKEPYIKLGRLAVLPEFRGRGIAHMLIKSALDWVRHNPTFFNPSVEYKSLHKIGVKEKTKEIIPVWNGLMCVHSQADEKVVRAWAKWGFKTDDAMGSWEEEGIKHVGMFMRLNLNGEGWLPLKENKVG